ncbi:hypothetical protein ASD02_34840 [Ensifer sp. Root1252]|nr:hypothetical protein ASD00_34655 [Ensifer sp. Root31]KQW46842.1 hypothetical protein ASD02_34840 [Ensifer sp. Root1252]KQY69509.1 hypothetical protein ASD52_32275 [Ensifer sp. Root142]KRC69397.1 hypothetical protein ASE32_34665 [Ensifer sp. Root231]KRC96673.1 hypothetical protein ASE47_30930 [Ensifer sp. Root258]MDP9634346.1 hypothetical protein [Ensifer adhaerens]NOV20984.1 hypothetical protein [Ensifer canadensis]
MPHREHARTIIRWKNEGHAPHQIHGRYQFGRRVEVDGSWTIYHVFSGKPAQVDAWRMTGLNRENADQALDVLNTY